MKKSAELRQELNALVSSQSAIMEKAKGESRSSLNAEEKTAFDNLQKQIEEKRSDLQTQETLEENLRHLGGGAGVSQLEGEQREFEKVKGQFSILKAMRSAAKGNLDGAEAEINEIALKEMRESGRLVDNNNMAFHIPASMVRATTQSVTGDSGNYGGSMVVPQAPRLVDSFIPKTFLEELGATVWTGLQGGAVPLPVMNNFTYQWLAENDTITPTAAGVAGPSLSAKRAASQVNVSKTLINQSSIDVEATVMRLLGRGAANALNAAAINGPGTLAPTGILNMSGVSASALLTTAGLPTFAIVNELKGLIEAYDSSEVNLGYLCHPSLLALLETTAKAASQGFISDKNMINGYKTVATSLVTKIAGTPDLYPLIFGDFSQLFIGQWGGISFIVDPYTGAGSNSLVVTVDMQADVQVANKKAFAKNTFLKLS